MLVLCCLKLGGARGQAERGELVFLQVPGFKKLQAFLHSQAFLQTLGETKQRAALGRGRRSGTAAGMGSWARISGACWGRTHGYGGQLLPGDRVRLQMNQATNQKQ